MSASILPLFPSFQNKIRKNRPTRARSENLPGEGLFRPAFSLWPGLLCLPLLFGLAAPTAAQQQALNLSGGDALAPPSASDPVVTVTRVPSLGGIVDESNLSLNFVVTANPAPSSSLSVTLSVTATHTAATPTPSGTGTVTVTVPTSGSVTHTVGIVDDSNVETDGTVTVTVNSGTGYTVGNPSSTMVSVEDDDLPPATLALTPTQVQAGSLDGATITLNPDNATFFAAGGSGSTDGLNPVTSYVNSADLVNQRIPNTAVRLSATGLAFVTLSGAPAGLTIASGRLLARQTGVRSTRGVSQYRPAEITLAYSGSAITADDPVTVTVDNNLLRLNDGEGGKPPDLSADFTIKAATQSTPVAQFASGSSSAAESAGTQNVTVNLSPAPSANITVNYSLSGTATRDADYTISGVTSNNGSVSVGGGDTSVNIPVAIADDSADETSETLILTLTNGTGYNVGNANAHTLTITDDDGGGDGGGGGGTGGGGGGGGDDDPSEVTLSVAPNPVVEGEDITVTVGLSRLVSIAVTIPLVLTAGTAEAGDYDALASIVIDANEPNAMGVIATTKDDDRDDETFTVTLGTLPAGLAAGAQATAQVTIADATVTSIESPAEEIPTAFALEQNYPNPFNPTTTIAFALDKTQHVTLAVYDLLGQEVQVLVDAVRPAARYRVPFDATDLASGTYLYVLRTETQTAVKTMALLK